MIGAPWQDEDTMLARAFERALDRLSAATPRDDGQPIARLGSHETALMFSGLDIDVNELDTYIGALAANYLHTLNRRASAEVAEAIEQDKPREEQLKRSRGVATRLFRGAIQTGALAGALYGVELERTTGTGKPLSPREQPGEIGPASEPWMTQPGRVPTIAERIELSRDSVQWVLDMEADRLDRMSTTLAELGIERAANLMRAAAIVIRYELAGGDSEFPAVIARQQQAQREQLAVDQAQQLERFHRFPAERQQRYLAQLEELELRHEEERRGLEDPDA
jgi:hypothetical protein